MTNRFQKIPKLTVWISVFHNKPVKWPVNQFGEVEMKPIFWVLVLLYVLFFVNVVCSCLPFQTFQIVFPMLPLQTEECSEEDKRLKTKVFFLGGGWVVVGVCYNKTLSILLPPSVSNAFSAPRTKCLHHIGEAGREERREPLGRKTSGRVWKKDKRKRRTRRREEGLV